MCGIEFLDLMAPSLHALGLREADLTELANAISIALNDSGTIKRATVERFNEIFEHSHETIEKTRSKILL